jgi:hypothetical protein
MHLDLRAMRLSLDFHLSFGKDDQQEDRYEDGVGTHHQAGFITGINHTRPEDQ